MTTLLVGLLTTTGAFASPDRQPERYQHISDLITTELVLPANTDLENNRGVVFVSYSVDTAGRITVLNTNGSCSELMNYVKQKFDGAVLQPDQATALNVVRINFRQA
ncbi:MAG: hypothetical protein AAGB22_04890 [Bacteroidota bacterium]